MCNLKSAIFVFCQHKPEDNQFSVLFGTLKLPLTLNGLYLFIYLKILIVDLIIKMLAKPPTHHQQYITFTPLQFHAQTEITTSLNRENSFHSISTECPSPQVYTLRH